MGQKRRVPSPLDKQLADFLRRQRGGQTFAEFSRKLGLPPSTLHRLEQCEQSVTLGRLHQITVRLKCRLRDIFSTSR
jgi:transcriptional regulator with XRE-family HTH domain